MDEYTFDLAPKQTPVTIDGKRYVIREASADAATRWRNAMMTGSKVDTRTGMATAGQTAESEPLLLSLCLFEIFGDPERERPVQLATIRSWPERVVKKLLAIVYDLSELTQPGKEKPEATETTDGEPAKNGQCAAPNATTAISG